MVIFHCYVSSPGVVVLHTLPLHQNSDAHYVQILESSDSSDIPLERSFPFPGRL